MKNKLENQVIIAAEDLEISLSALDLPSIITMDPALSFSEATKMMKEKKIGSLTLGHDGELLGIFTERDCISKFDLILEDPTRPLSDLMTKSPLTLSTSDTFLDALSLMASREFRHVPIVDENGKLTKMISVKDILGYIANLFGDYLDAFKAIPNWSKKDVSLQEDAILYDLKKEEGTLSEDVLDVPLKRIYDPNFSSFDIETPIKDVVMQMKAKRRSMALIFEYETEIRGVVTERDILYKVFAGGVELSCPVKSIMTENPHLLNISHQFGNAFKNMFTYGYRNVPVANSEGYAMGNVSLLELLIFLAGELGVRNRLQFSSEDEES